MAEAKGDGVGLGGSCLGGWKVDVLGFGADSCLGDRIDSRDDLVVPAEAQVVLDGLRELLGVELFGSGGTAYTVCLDTGAGGAPVGRLCFDAAAWEVEARGPDGLKDFDFWILPMRPASPCFRLRNRYPSPEPPPTPRVRTMNG